MSAVISSVFGAGAQLFTNAGVVLAGGKIYTYAAGTTTAAATWTDSTQVTQNPNPIVLDSAGRVPNEIWLTNAAYKFVVQDANSNTLGTYDNIPGVNASTATFSEWTAGLAATYISSTSFSVAGNQTAIYQVNRRIQYTVTGGTFYGTINSSTYGSVTTVVFTPDSTGLDTSVGNVNYGFMSATNSSVPAVYVLSLNAALTGTPTAPTASAGTNTTQIATTAFVAANFAGLVSPAFTGTPTAPTATTGNNTTQIATTAFVAATAFNAALPSQGGNAGKFVTTDGSNASWSLVYPTQTGNTGKFLTTDGTNTSWATIVVPDFLLYAQGII